MYSIPVAGILLLASVVAVAADFTAKDMDGGRQSLSAYHGKWVVLDFWATWCPYCVEEIPELNAFYRAHHEKDAVVLGLSVDENDELKDEELKDFVQMNDIAYPVVRATPAILQAIGPVRGLPTLYLVDPAGNIVARQVGPLTRADLEQFLRRHAKSSKAVFP